MKLVNRSSVLNVYYNMAKYRIKKHYEYSTISYEVQKKVWFIPFWYNFNNVDADETGFYGTRDKALEAIDRNRYKTKHTIIEV